MSRSQSRDRITQFATALATQLRTDPLSTLLENRQFNFLNWMFALLLAVLAYGANAIDLTLFHPVAFIFGSTFAIVALRLLSLPAAVLVALIGGLYTVVAWGHAYALVVMTCEIVCVGYLLRRIENVVLADMLFWGFLGLPLVTFFYTAGIGLTFETGSFIAIKQAVNGVFNAVLAGFLLFVLRFANLPKALTPNEITLRSLIFKVVAFVGITSTSLIIIAETRSHYGQAIDNVERLLRSVSATVERTLDASGSTAPLSLQQLQTLRDLLALSPISYEPIRDLSISITTADVETAVLLGKPRYSVDHGETDFYSARFGRWTSSAEMPEMQRALESRFVHLTNITTPGLQGELRTELSTTPVVSYLENGGRQKLLMMAAFIIVILSVSHFMISWIVAPLSALSSASGKLADRITSGASLEPLPKSHIREFDGLADTIGCMASSLSDSFKKQEELARTLEKRVNERTEQLSLMSRVAQQTTDSVVVTDAQGLTTWVNRSFERLTGYHLQEMLGKTPGSLLQKERPPEHVLENMRASIARADSFHVEVVNHKKDGTPYWVEIRCNPMVGSDGRHTGFIAIETDITERKDLTRSLNSSLRRLQLATEAAELGVWVYRTATNSLEWNTLNYTLHGLDQVADHDPLSLWLSGIVEADRTKVQEIFSSDYDWPETTMRLEYRFLDPNRGTRTMVATFCALTSSDGGARLTGVTRDVTDERNAQRDIKEAGNHTQAILDNVIDGVVAIDVDGCITSFNKAAENMFGYTAAEILGEDISRLMTAEQASFHSGFIKNYLATGRTKVMGRLSDFRAQRKDGSTFPILLGVTEVKTQSNHFFIGIIRDASAEKRLQEQLRQAQKLEAVGQLTGGISHDFNNLLTVILGSAEMLIDRIKDRPDLKRPAEMILSAAENGAELTSRLLAFSRRQALSPRLADIALLLTGMSELLQRSIGQSIMIEFLIGEDPCLVELDTAQFEAAILNLALNARDAMPNGGSLQFKIAECSIGGQGADIPYGPEEGQYFSVAVTDTGIGMDEHQLHHAFEPFFTTKDVGRGSGLGLSMVFGFVQQSKGHISIQSQPGLGTTVELLFPRYEIKEKGTQL